MKPKTTVTSVLETFPSLHKLIVCCKFDDMAWLLCRTYWNNLKYGKKIVNAAGNEGTEVDKFAPKALTSTLHI